jgi:hypothetical protein
MKTRRFAGRPFLTTTSYRPRKKMNRAGGVKKRGRPRSSSVHSVPEPTLLIQQDDKRACSSCYRILPVSRFAVDKRCRDGFSRRCKHCTEQKKLHKAGIGIDVHRTIEQETPGSSSLKTCHTCNRALPLEAFHKSTKTKDGRRSMCKTCRSAHQKEVQERYQQERIQHPIREKHCTACQHTLPTESFYPDKNTKDGYATYCKECARNKQEEYLKSLEERRQATPSHLKNKTCIRCHRTLAIDRFTNNHKTMDGFSGVCKDCERDRRRALFSRWQHKKTPVEKQCTHCKRILPASNFSRTKKAKDGLLYMCKDCAATYYENMKTRWAQERKKSEVDISLFTTMEKTCFKCNRTLPLSAFYHTKDSRDGLTASCKECDGKKAKVQSEQRKARPKIIPETKTCRLCQQTLPASDFGRNIQKHDGLDALCRTCRTNKYHEYLAKPEAMKKRLIQLRAYNHRPDVLARNRKRAVAKAKQKAYQKEYHKRPDVIQHQREYMQRYLARKRAQKA